MKKLIYLVFIVFILASIFVVVISICNNEWETVIASISLIIAIISGWIAQVVFYRHAQAEKPQIILRLDFESRYSLVLLVAENLGTKPAFNIKINWDRELIDHKGNPVRFNKYDNSIEIPVLNPKEKTSAIVDKPSAIIDKCKEEDNFNFGGIITYQEILKSKKMTSCPFQFSLEHHGNSPLTKNEEPKAMYEIQKIPKILNEIKAELKKMNEKPESPSAQQPV